MWPLNRALGAVFDLLVLPFRGMPPIVGLTVISLLVSVGILFGFGATSDQRALGEVRRRIHAGVYEIRLFKDDLPTILAAQLGILRHTMTYFRLSIVPMLWMMVPIVIVVIQLQFQYGYDSLEPGRTAVVEVELTEDAAERTAAAAGSGEARGSAGTRADGTDGAGRPSLSLEAPKGVRVETPPVWIPSLGEAGWRIRAESPGVHELVVRVGDERLTKTVRVGGSAVRRSPVRPSGILGQIVYPAEAPLPAGSGVEAIRVGYADAAVALLGWEMHWIIAFFILTMIFAFALQKPLGVKI